MYGLKKDVCWLKRPKITSNSQESVDRARADDSYSLAFSRPISHCLDRVDSLLSTPIFQGEPKGNTGPNEKLKVTWKFSSFP